VCRQEVDPQATHGRLKGSVDVLVVVDYEYTKRPSCDGVEGSRTCHASGGYPTPRYRDMRCLHGIGEDHPTRDHLFHE
jgi:hypothetical protein